MSLRSRARAWLKAWLDRQVAEPDGISRARRESNAWLRTHCPAIRGNVLSAGSGNDADGEGDCYRNYFSSAASYTTSEVSADYGCDLTLDIRFMSGIKSGAYDCIYCSGVLEHVDDFRAAFDELTRVLAGDGILLLGLPFRQAIHMAPQDYWRFTEFGIRHLLGSSFEIQDITPIDVSAGIDFPAAYWVRARKIRDRTTEP